MMADMPTRHAKQWVPSYKGPSHAARYPTGRYLLTTLSWQIHPHSLRLAMLNISPITLRSTTASSSGL